jgi:hypothetical protein
LQNRLTDSITYTTIEKCDEGSLVRVFACSKEPEPVGGTQIRTEGTLKMEHKPYALIRRYITISGSLIDTRRSFCQKSEYDRGCIKNKMTLPHMPEFSTTRSFPGVGVGAMFEKVSLEPLQS